MRCASIGLLGRRLAVCRTRWDEDPAGKARAGLDGHALSITAGEHVSHVCYDVHGYC